MPMIDLYHGDCLAVLKTLPDASVDAVITDPPYGLGIDEWDKPVDVDAFAGEAFRLSRGFYAVFGQMPSLRDWDAAALRAGFRFVEHVVWVKRQVSPVGRRLGRSHESVYIYAKRPGLPYHRTKGPYEDVKLPGVLVDTVTLEGIDRHVKDLRLKMQGRSDGSVCGEASHPAYSRLNSFPGDRSPAEVGYSNVWSFYPPNCAKKTGRHLHPTVKPLDIMARLCEMLTPSGGTVLDPFFGSGTTGVAAVQGGFGFIGIEQSLGYLEIARARIAQVKP